MPPRFLIPDGEVADEVRAILPDQPWITFAEAEEGADVSSVEFFVPPYLKWGEALELLGRLPALRVVQLLTAGVDWIAPSIPSGVRLHRAVGVHAAAVTELVVAMILGMAKGVPSFVRHQARAEWAHVRVGSVFGSHAVILGHGAIGREVGTALEALGIRVTGVSRSGHPPSVPLSGLAELLPSCDVLVIVLPLTDDTKGLVDGAMLSLLSDGALVVNVARGSVVQHEALEGELVAGRLRAALDVTDPEPLPADSPLWQLPNVLITPHVGGDSDLFPRLAGRLVADQMTRYLEGRELDYEVVGTY